MTDDQNKVQETFLKLRNKLVSTYQDIDGVTSRPPPNHFF